MKNFKSKAWKIQNKKLGGRNRGEREKSMSKRKYCKSSLSVLPKVHYIIMHTHLFTKIKQDHAGNQTDIDSATHEMRDPASQPCWRNSLSTK